MASFPQGASGITGANHRPGRAIEIERVIASSTVSSTEFTNLVDSPRKHFSPPGAKPEKIRTSVIGALLL